MPTSFPARFVGEFDRNSDSDEAAYSVPNKGDVAIVRGYPDGIDRAYIRCACGAIDMIPIAGPNGWKLVSRDPVHLEPSVLVKYFSPEETRCHYFVKAGRLEMLDDTTRPYTLLPTPPEGQ